MTELSHIKFSQIASSDNEKTLSIRMFCIALLFFLTLGFSNAHAYTHLGEITKTIHESGRYDVHITYFDREVEKKKLLETYKQSSPDQYLITVEGKKKVEIYKPSDEVRTLITQAEKFIADKKFNKAEPLLKKALEKDPEYSRLCRLMAQLEMAKGKNEKAILLLNTALEKNPIDFTAYKLRGDCFVQNKENEKALDDYIMSIINGRNYAEAWNALENLGKIMGLQVEKEPFVPLYSIQALETGKHRVYYDDNEKARWMPYSYCKTVWLYEPGYFKQRTGKDKYEYTFEEEDECIKNMIWAYGAFRRQGKFPEDPLLERLNKIKSRMFLREFIVFEIMSPKNPEMLLTMDEKYLSDLKDYMREFVVVKKD